MGSKMRLINNCSRGFDTTQIDGLRSEIDAAIAAPSQQSHFSQFGIATESQTQHIESSNLAKDCVPAV